MFCGNWAESAAAKEPISMTEWGLPEFLLALAHLYTGWVPTVMEPPVEIAGIFTKFGTDIEELKHFDVLTKCLNLAQMLECADLMKALRPCIVRALDERIDSAIRSFEAQTLESEAEPEPPIASVEEA
ncbi:hypothetical protein H9P43_007288 [Blastocladiella emersonii ATCC 22665]|nr:hypothetical protein H9P43_007288 [Blastocladiella emersonii ATCC 22665]